MLQKRRLKSKINVRITYSFFPYYNQLSVVGDCLMTEDQRPENRLAHRKLNSGSTRAHGIIHLILYCKVSTASNKLALQ